MLLVGNGQLFTRWNQLPMLFDGAVAIDGECITEIGTTAALKAKYPGSSFVDAKGGLIMPGFINAHTHIYSGLARGLSIPGNNPTDFLEVLEGTWWNIDRHLTLEMTRSCAYATVLECIRNGVTTIFDHHASFAEIPGSLFAIADVCRELGIRANLCYEVSDRDGAEKCNEAIAENADFARWAAAQKDDMITALFGGHALFTISDKTFEKMVAANDGLTGFHIHVAEGMNDVYDSLRRHGCRPINRLLYHGVLGEQTLLGHCIHISPAEMEIIAETGTMTVNCPASNMNNGVGCSPVLQMQQMSICTCMGTDAYTHDILDSLKTFLLIQRHNAALPGVAWSEGCTMVFQNNARLASKFIRKPLGVLRPGAAADVVVMDYRPFTPLNARNLDGHMIFGMSGSNCRTTIVNGRVLYQDYEFTGFDAAALRARICAQSRQLWRDLGCNTD